MNTTPILAAAVLLVSTAPSFSQDDPLGGPSQPRDEALLQKIDVIDMVDVALPDMIRFLQAKVGTPLNFVIKDPADEVVLPPMQIRNITVQTLLDTIETLAAIEISTVSAGGEGAPVIVIEARKLSVPAPRPYGIGGAWPEYPAAAGLHPPAVESQGAGSKEQPYPVDRRTLKNLQLEELPWVTRVVNPGANPEPVTRAYPVRGTLETIEFGALHELIHEFWDRSAPEWLGELDKAAISFHEPTGMLIVKAPQPRQEELQSLLDGLGRGVATARKDNDEARKLRQVLAELEHKADLSARFTNEERAVRQDTEDKLRHQLDQKDEEITELRRVVSELKDALERR